MNYSVEKKSDNYDLTCSGRICIIFYFKIYYFKAATYIFNNTTKIIDYFSLHVSSLFL